MQCFKLKEKVGYGRQEGGCSGNKHWYGAVLVPGKMAHGLLLWRSKTVEGGNASPGLGHALSGKCWRP